MRKSIFIIAALLICGIMVFVSCSKEEVKSKNPETTVLSSDNLEVIKTIKDFKQKVAYYQENPSYKSGEAVTTDDALVLLEGTMNYSHAFTMDYYDEVLMENITLMVTKTISGEVDMDELIEKYNEMKSCITENYENSNFSNKGLVLVDVSETSQTESELILDVAMVTGDRNDPPVDGIGGPFSLGDDWWYGEDAGTCDGTTQTSSDAAQKISAEMAKYIYHYTINHGILFYMYPTTEYRKGGDLGLRRPYDPNPQDNYMDYYLYNADTAYGSITNDVLCVGLTEMNLYYSCLEYLLYTKIPDEISTTYNYKPAQIIDMQGIQDPLNFGHYYHEGSFLFGVPYYYDEGEGPEEL